LQAIAGHTNSIG